MLPLLPRSRRLVLALLCSILIAFVIQLFADRAGSSMIWRGDFPGFYVLGEIFLRGEGEQIYHRVIQERVEREAWSSMNDSVLLSLYPPFFALFCAPFAALGPYIGKLFFSLINLCAWIGSIVLLSRAALFNREMSKDILPLSLLFPPVLISILGGQNTALTMFLLSASALLLRSEKGKIQLFAGIISALLLYKPQFGLMIAFPLMLVTTSYFRIGYLLSSLALILLSFYVSGVDWPGSWLELARVFAPENFKVNGPMMYSINSLGYWIDSYFGLKGIFQWIAVVVSLSVYAALVIIFTLKVHQRSLSVSEGVIYLAAGITVLSPQTLFYDLGIMSPVLFYIASNSKRGLLFFIVVAVFTLLAFHLRDLGLPLFSILAVPLLMAVFQILIRRSSSLSFLHREHGF